MRRGYTTRRGVRVPAMCIVDVGAPGKGAKTLPTPTAGALGQYGYSPKKAARERAKALAAAVAVEGYATIIRRLNLIANYTKKSQPQNYAIYRADMDVLRKRYWSNPSNAIAEAISLSSGTFASLTGYRDYATIDKIRAMWIEWIQGQEAKGKSFPSWQLAWSVFVYQSRDHLLQRSRERQEKEVMWERTPYARNPASSVGDELRYARQRWDKARVRMDRLEDKLRRGHDVERDEYEAAKTALYQASEDLAEAARVVANIEHAGRRNPASPEALRTYDELRDALKRWDRAFRDLSYVTEKRRKGEDVGENEYEDAVAAYHRAFEEISRATPEALRAYADRAGLVGRERQEFVKKGLRENPLLLTVGANPRAKRAPSNVDPTKAPGYKAAVAKYKEFHGVEPTEVAVMRIDDGKKAITRKVVAGLGRVPEVQYVTDQKPGEFNGSNKTGYRWVHKTKKNDMPVLAYDPETKSTMHVGGAMKVKDWLRD